MQLEPSAQTRLASLRGKRVGIVGLGREGVDLALFLARAGAHVMVSDQAMPDALRDATRQLDGLEIEYRIGGQGEADLLDREEVFVSPGVPQEIPMLESARQRGIALSSATELFFDLCPGRIVGITGSSGKTTTTSLVGAMLKAQDRDVLVGGNIGTPLLGHLDHVTGETWCVLELSSFQLANLFRSPPFAAILNITPNHLDRHPDMEDYIRAKSNIIRHQGAADVAVLNADDAITASLPHESRSLFFSLQREVDGAWFDGHHLWMRGEQQPILHRSALHLRGDHNVANALAAVLMATATGCSLSAIRATLAEFEPVPHRLEVVGTVNGVTFINDSIATSPERSIAALRAIDSPVVLIAGGRDKHLPMEEWARAIADRVRAVVLVGEAAPLIRRALDAANVTVPVVHASTFGDTVSMARDLAQAGDTVLLSPGCTSFDEFRDFAGRGEAFRALVAQLGASGA
jgi:UDP-N-acetylmuramoylalanine--D-glutamate ligase